MIEPTRYNIKGKTVVVGRGQFAISVRRLADEFGWSKSATHRFLARLKTETMIETASGTGQIVITICNYDIYQKPENSRGTVSGTVSGTAAGQQRDTKEEGEEKKKKDSCAFSAFWAAFPAGRKTGKKKCISVFNAAVKSGVSPEHIIEAVKKYAAHVAKRRTEDRYIKNSTTWLNQGCWDDELETGREDGALDNQGIRKVENGMGDSERGGDRGEAPPRNAEDVLPGMFGSPEEENRSVPVGDVQAGRDRLEMLALSDGGGIVF